ncbi:N-acetylglucosamine-6-phosphate deacetylase [Allorhizobium taibaishanense]|uniref:N-acetylglucosamine-6-phosphate deacetylase n=1 Tax=Allorhizobium taibaishanense TaxID=887144 RepID=A0A1Q9A9P2_9HYPH|nr:N-acetylglucosamine-6-phosphate deacetylase [Allorhizobium taibaishanense]MBB4009932.1 N-acetylglucosamine-6-phosphate deacetylase [Allorhizobium taibaishanense]OLP51557.1 N-acetylglucosamine-6-phosphate deacetylase [Allorhizobium taibaishanense]
MIPSLPASFSFAVTGGKVFDGAQFHDGKALIIADGRIVEVADLRAVSSDLPRVDAAGTLVVPGFVDLQVNGGGGVLLNNQPDLDGIRTICAAHARFGTTALLPTLITDRSELRDDVLALGRDAVAAMIPGYLGLHLEGPHLSLARKGTHDPSLIRPMRDEDLARLVASAGTFGQALITVAPESVTVQQVLALVAAGYHVSLGHTDTSCSKVSDYVDAGVTLVTHLFNAMSQMGNREPGLVGAALNSGALHCGLIADGFHVDPVSMQVALRAKRGPGRIFLVTDAMSSIGTNETGFMLNGRQVYRRDGRLTLADGTLAGADIDMLSCVRFVRDKIGLSLEEALNMASLYPADAIGAAAKGRLAPGADADFLLLTPTLDLLSTWIGGTCMYQASETRQGARA